MHTTLPFHQIVSCAFSETDTTHTCIAST